MLWEGLETGTRRPDDLVPIEGIHTVHFSVTYSGGRLSSIPFTYRSLCNLVDLSQRGISERRRKTAQRDPLTLLVYDTLVQELIDTVCTYI